MSTTTARSLDGAALAATMKADLAGEVQALRAAGVTPGLGTILVGDDPASATYVGLKHRDCAEIGIDSFGEHLPANASQSDLLSLVRQFNANPAIDAYLVQLPLPRGLDEEEVLLTVDPEQGRRWAASDQPRSSGHGQAWPAAMHAGWHTGAPDRRTTSRSLASTW